MYLRMRSTKVLQCHKSTIFQIKRVSVNAVNFMLHTNRITANKAHKKRTENEREVSEYYADRRAELNGCQFVYVSLSYLSMALCMWQNVRVR